MNQQLNKLQPLALPRTNVIDEHAFANDLLGRQNLADRLTGYLDRLRVGAVLAIDAPWGEGKTWFGRNWAKHLESDTHKHKVVFIDAFAQDYMEDPFLLIAAEITAVMGDENGTAANLRKKAADVMKAILPVGAKALLNLAGRVALGPTNLSDDFQDAAKSASEGAADATSKWIEKKLEDYTSEKLSLESFRVELAKFAAAQDKPVIVFIDELDRCRPTFAVQLIERIKHFFDVPNLIFVLLLNRDQLEKAIEGVYGPKTDAATYLSKFVHLFLRLPKNTSRDTYSSGNSMKVFIKDVLSRYGFTVSQSNLVNSITAVLSQWAIATDMSLRDIERACALFVMANSSQPELFIYLIVLKVKRQSLYERLVRNDVNAHKEAADLLTPLIHEKKQSEMRWPDYYFKALQELHQLQIGVEPSTEPNCLSKYGQQLFGRGGFDIESTFASAFNRIELPVENY